MSSVGELNLSEDSSDEEVEITGGTFVSFNDPWTMKLIRNPVRNKVCNHVYDRDSAKLIIKVRSSGQVSCPIMGCANKNVKACDLVKDRDAMLKIREIRKKSNEKDTQVCIIDLVDD